VGVAPLVDCEGSPGSDLVDGLNEADLDADLLEAGITDPAAARQFDGFRVVVWGICYSPDTVTLNIELLNTVSPEGIIDPPTITTDALVNVLNQTAARTPRLIRAVTEYARGSSDYAALSNIFSDLAESASSVDERDALLILKGNSLLYIGDYEGAISQYIQIGSRRSAVWVAINNRGMARLNQAYENGNPNDELFTTAANDAAGAFNSLISNADVTDSGKARALINLGVTRYLLMIGGTNVEAFEWAFANCEIAAELTPNQAAAYACQGAAIYFMLREANDCTHARDFDRALNALNRAEELDTEYAYTYFWRGSLYLLQVECENGSSEQARYRANAEEEFTIFLDLMGRSPIHLITDTILIGFARVYDAEATESAESQ
jgi:tetratricopeptide (TPR) repeat protein